MSTKIVIDNSSGSFAIDGIVGSAPVPSEAGATLISNSSNEWVSQAVPTSWRNRLINGDMAISQRNGDAFITPTSSGVYAVDRWRASQSIEGNNSVYFDGSGDSLSTAALSLTDVDFTIEAWIYLDANNATSTSRIIATSYGSVGTTRYQVGSFIFSVDASDAIKIQGAGSTVIASSAVQRNVWHHVAMTYVNATRTYAGYLNGVQFGSAVDRIYNQAPSFYIGGSPADNVIGSWWFRGYISNLRVLRGTVLYTGNFTPPTSALNSITNTSLIACAAPTVKDLSTNNRTVTAAGNAAVSPAQPFGDAWSNYFDGSGDYLTAGSTNEAAFDFGTGDFTVETWFYLNASSDMTIASLSIPGGVVAESSNAWYFESYPSATGVRFVLSSGSTQYVVSSSALQIGRWYHLAATRSSGTLRLFVDGVLQSSTSANVTVNTPVGRRLSIGYYSLNAIRYVNGHISNLRIVKGTALYTANFTPNASTPLTAVSGTSLLTCASNKFQDLSANNFAITRAGNVAVSSTTAPIVGNKLTATAGRETGYSAYFDGNGDYLNIPYNSALDFGSGDFTFETWFYIAGNSATSGSGIRTAAIYSSQASDGRELHITIAGDASTTGTGISLSFYNGSSYVVQHYAAASISQGVWHHLAITRSSSSIKTFLNGTQIGATSTNSSNITSNSAYRIGMWNHPSIPSYYYYFNGYFSNMRLVKGRALYTSSFTPSTTPLVPVTSTSLLACASSTFADKSSNNFTVTAAGNAAVSAINPFSQAGFGNSLRWAVSTPASPASTNQALIQQRIEGSNIYDFSWGTAGARAATLSFWVNSPVVGTYCVAVQNPSLDRSYVAEYTVSAANTWERKTVNVPGPTSGFWPTNNSEGLRVSFDMGSGTNYNTTAGAWQTGNFTRTAGALSFSAQALVASSLTNNFYVVGTQLELGSVATPFEVIPYAKQIESCQRYYARMGSWSGNYVGFGAGCTFQGGTSVGIGFVYVKYPQRMRAAPTINQSGTAIFNTTVRAVTSLAAPYVGTDSLSVSPFTAANTQTVGQGVVWTGNNNASAYIDLDAEL